MNTSEVLNRAADLIEERGWAKGSGWNTDGSNTSGPLCVEGALTAVLGVRQKWDCPAWRAVAEYVATRGDAVQVHPQSGFPILWVWNDDVRWDEEAGAVVPCRTAAEVIEVLRAAAVIEQARETERTAVTA